MKVTNKMALILILVLISTAAFVCAQDTDQTPPQRQGAIFDDAYIAQLLEKVKANDPNEAQRLEKLRDENPRLFQVAIRKLAWQYKEPRQGMERHRFRRSPQGEQTVQTGREMLRDRLRNAEAELVSWLEKNEPKTAKELTALKEKDPRAYMRRLSIEMRKYREIIEAEQTNPALAELLKKDLDLKQKRNELLEQYKAATDEKQKTKLMVRLEDVMGERFDLILQKKQLKYEELKKKLKELQKSVDSSQAELENYKNSKDELIKKHLDELISQSGRFDWD